MASEISSNQVVLIGGPLMLEGFGGDVIWFRDRYIYIYIYIFDRLI